MSNKPWVYVASPYTKGDPSINAHFQCRIFDRLMNDRIVWPYAPLWTHFQHGTFPRHYQDWVDYDNATIPRLDACLRLDAEHEDLKYLVSESKGADAEVELFKSLDKPVFFSIDDLYEWARQI